MEGVEKCERTVGLLGLQTGFQAPVSRTIGFLYLLLLELGTVQLCAWLSVKTHNESGAFFNFFTAHNQALAGASCQKRNACMNTENFQNLFREREHTRGHKHQTQRNLRCA